MSGPGIAEGTPKDIVKTDDSIQTMTSTDLELSNQFKTDTTMQEKQFVTDYIQKFINGYTKYNFIGEQLWEAFVDDFEDFKTQQDWQRGDNVTVRAFRDMLRARGVYLPKERGANTISKHLAILVNSSTFPEWDKNDKEYQKVSSLLQFSTTFARDLAQLRISDDPCMSPTSQRSQMAADKTSAYEDSKQREDKLSYK